VLSDRTRRQPGDIGSALGRLWGKISGKPNENKTMTAQAVDYLRGKSDTTGGAYVARNLADPVPGFKETHLSAQPAPSTVDQTMPQRYLVLAGVSIGYICVMLAVSPVSKSSG